MAVIKNKSTEKYRQFWEHVEAVAAEVRSMPQWMRGYAVNRRCGACGNAGLRAEANDLCPSCEQTQVA